jgi:uncharacterized protein (TIGR02246 family)
MAMKRLIPATVMLFLAACAQAPTPAADTRDADVKAIREIDAEMQRAWIAKDSDKLGSYYAANGSLMIPNMPAVKGGAAISATAKELFAADPTLSLTFQSNNIEVSKAGDLAYSEGTYALMATDQVSKRPVTEKGKYVTVFQKQADNSWKIVADINNADVPTTPAASK